MSNIWTPKLVKPRLGTPLVKGHRLSKGLVGCWLMNEGGGNIVNDLSGNGTTCSFENGLTWGAGKYGSKTVFDGIDDKLSGIKQPPTCLNQITIVWSGLLHSVASGGDVYGRIIDWYPAPSIYRVGGGDNRLAWYGNVGGTSRDYKISNTAFFDDTQHYGAVVFDGINTNVYKDGVLDKNNTDYSGALSSPINFFCIGSRAFDTHRTLYGELDYVYIYNRALTASEIAYLYRNPFAMFEKNDIVLWQSGEVTPAETAFMTTNTGYWG